MGSRRTQASAVQEQTFQCMLSSFLLLTRLQLSMPKITNPLTSQLALKRCSTVFSLLIKTAIQNGLLHFCGWSINLHRPMQHRSWSIIFTVNVKRGYALGLKSSLARTDTELSQQNLTLTAATFSVWRLLFKFDYSRSLLQCRRHSNNKGQYEQGLSIYSSISLCGNRRFWMMIQFRRKV